MVQVHIPNGGNLLELSDCETFREFQMKLKIPFLCFQWEGQLYLENNRITVCSVCVTNLSFSSRSASGASKEDWGEAFAVVVEFLEQ